MSDSEPSALVAPTRRAPSSRHGGRPTKFNADRAKTIVACIRDGGWRAACARKAGISDRTLYSWLEAGRERTRGPFLQFLRDIEAAEAEAALDYQAAIKAAAPKDWRAAAWWLEKRMPEVFGKRDLRVQVDAHHTVDVLTRLAPNVLSLLAAGPQDDSPEAAEQYIADVYRAVGPKAFSLVLPGTTPPELAVELRETA